MTIVLIAAGRCSVHSSLIKPYISAYTRAFDAPIGWGFSSEYSCDVWYGKIRMVWLPEGEKNLKICLFVFTECVYERDRHTDRHRMTAKHSIM